MSGQVARIRPLAEAALGRFGLPAATMRCLNHGYNTTFAVKAAGQRYALRLNTNSARTLEQIRAEVAWVSALHAEGSVSVALPVPTREGDPVVVLDWPESVNCATPGQVCAVLYAYLPGRSGMTKPIIAHAIGKVMRQLHEHARTWSVPPGAALEPMNDILFGHGIHAKVSETADVGVYKEVLLRANAALARLAKSAPIPIHADIHWSNVKWYRNTLSVFDFDDSVLGWPTLDAAITLFYVRRSPESEAGEAAFWDGFGHPESHEEDALEALIAGRQLLLSSDLFNMTTANLSPMAPGYAKAGEVRMRHYLKTGRFDPSVCPFP